jgi:hypothetical protein
MSAPSLEPTDRVTLSVLQRERLRRRAEFEDVIAGTRQTIAQSQALLVEADAILAKEKIAVSRHYSRDDC